MFRVILSLGEGIKVTAHMLIFSPSQHRRNAYRVTHGSF